MMTAMRKYQDSQCKRLPAPAKPIGCAALAVVLLASTLAVHAATAANDAQPGSLPCESNVVTDNPLPGAAMRGEALLVQSSYARAGSTLLWSRHGQLSAQARALINNLNAVESLGLRPRLHYGHCQSVEQQFLYGQVRPIRATAHASCRPLHRSCALRSRQSMRGRVRIRRTSQSATGSQSRGSGARDACPVLAVKAVSQ
jgi:hypothetical protein